MNLAVDETNIISRNAKEAFIQVRALMREM